MGKQYGEGLVLALKQRQKAEDYHGAPVLDKYLPDCDERGVDGSQAVPGSEKGAEDDGVDTALPDEDGHLGQGDRQPAQDVQRDQKHPLCGDAHPD